VRTPTDNGYEPISDINVTPFVDVLLVLLVVFMITAPLFSKAIDIQLPQENLRSSEMKDPQRLVVSVNHTGNTFIEGKAYSGQSLLNKIAEWREKEQQQTVFIRADRRVQYEKITALMVMLKNNGIHQLGLLVEDKL